MSATTETNHPIFYPESDGKPMAENTRQYRWIVTIERVERLAAEERTAEAQTRAERLAAQLRALGIDPAG